MPESAKYHQSVVLGGDVDARLVWDFIAGGTVEHLAMEYYDDVLSGQVPDRGARRGRAFKAIRNALTEQQREIERLRLEVRRFITGNEEGLVGG